MRLRLETIDGATGKRRTKWADAPFLAVTDRAWAPKVSFISFVDFGDDIEGSPSIHQCCVSR